MPLRQTDHGTMRIKKTGRMWYLRALENRSCVCVGYCSACVQFSSSRACNTARVHASACVPHTSTHRCSRVERPDLLTVMTRWRVKAFIFPLFYCKYSLGLQGERTPLALGKWKHRQAPGGEEEEGRMKRVNVPLHGTAKMQLEWSVRRFWPQDLRLGFSLPRILSNSARWMKTLNKIHTP